MSRGIPSSLVRAGTLGAAAAFAIGFAGATLGGWIESQWNIIVIIETAWLVWGFVTLGGFLVGSLAAMTRRVVVGATLGVVFLGAGMACFGLAKGGPPGFTIWTISVGVCAGAASGAFGGAIGRRGVKG